MKMESGMSMLPSNENTNKKNITDRLRGWAKADDQVWPSELMNEAADEIERLRTNLKLADAGFTLGPFLSSQINH